jgi:hypothetical protein
MVPSYVSKVEGKSRDGLGVLTRHSDRGTVENHEMSSVTLGFLMTLSQLYALAYTASEDMETCSFS